MNLDAVGVIGVGAIGRSLVRRLIEGGFSVVVYDVSSAAIDAAVAMGASATASPSRLAEVSRIVLSSLPEARNVEEAYFGDHGAAESAGLGQTFLDLSTIDRRAFLDFAERLNEGGRRSLDGAVIGDPDTTASGGATLLIGGDYRPGEPLSSVLAALSKDVIHTGPLGSAKSAKLASNLVVADHCWCAVRSAEPWSAWGCRSGPPAKSAGHGVGSGSSSRGPAA